MWPSVAQRLPTFLEQEGWIHILYPDKDGNITVGLGHLVGDGKVWESSKADALTCGFMRKGTGRPATEAEIHQDWKLIQDNPDWKAVFTGTKQHPVNKPLWEQTIVELSDEAIGQLIARDAKRFETALKGTEWFSKFDQYPADAQLGLLALCWAVGLPTKEHGWKNFAPACKELNWQAMAEHCTGSTIMPDRNARTQQAFKNAANIMAQNAKGWGHDIQIVLWPTVLLGEVEIRAGE